MGSRWSVWTKSTCWSWFRRSNTTRRKFNKGTNTLVERNNSSSNTGKFLFPYLSLASMINTLVDKTTHDVHKSRVGLCTIDDIQLFPRIMSLNMLELRCMYAWDENRKEKVMKEMICWFMSTHTLFSFSIHLIIVLYNQSDRCKSLKLSKNMLPNRRLPNGNHHHTFSHSFIHISTPTYKRMCALFFYWS